MRESLTRDFVKSARLPVINENCPACFEEPKERARVKKILQQEEAMVPALFSNLRRALLPLMHEKTYEAMKAVEADIERTGAAQQLQTVKRSREEGREEDDSNAAAAPEVSGLLDNKKCKSEPEMGDAIHHSLVQSRADVLLERDTQDEVTSERCTDTYCAPCYEIA